MPDSVSGTFYQRGDGKWCAALTVNGKRKVLYADNEREARKRLAKLQGELATNGTLPTPGKRTADDLLTEWLESAKPHLKPRTYSEYEALARRHICPAVGKVRLSKLEPAHVQRLCNRLTAEGKKRQSRLVFNLLHRALGVGVLWGWLPGNPADRIVKPVYHAERKEVWTGEQLATFLEGTKDHWLGPLFMTAACSGCRISELVGLKWEDVDPVQGTLTIRRGLHRISGEWVAAAPKSKAGARGIVLPQEAVDSLRRQKKRQLEQRLRLGPEWQDYGLAFSGEKGQPLHRSVVFHALGRECKRLGLPTVGPHQLRHAHASVLLAQGLPVTAVSARLGHANPAITMSIYAHAMKRQDGEAAEAIGRVLRANKNL